MLKVEESWKEKTVLLIFEGVAHSATVYLNGEEIGKHDSGYTAFTIDISSYLDFEKENILVVKVDSRETLNIPPVGKVIDYMTYGGIYREAYMEVKNKNYISDMFVYTKDVQDDEKSLYVEIELNEFEEGLTIEQELSNINNKEEIRQLGTEVATKTTSRLKKKIVDVELWDIDKPELYYLNTKLIKDGEVVDSKSTRFGFRETSFKNDGFYLNGRKIKLRGLNRHQSYPYVGYAMPKSPQIRDAELLKYELGANAVRTSHYPQSQYFIDRCDEIGLLVFTEIPGWQHIGNNQWKDIACKNVEEMILQYRNHPSIIIWGVRINESNDDDEFYKKTNEIAHRL
ncbi:MAG: glycoside hydrolase family 2 TIM barrel-domain containing protein, partial [Clostridium sp.]